MRHSAGPWSSHPTILRRDDAEHDFCITGDPKPWCTKDADGNPLHTIGTSETCIAIVMGDNTNQETTAANVRLIEAAPDYAAGVEQMLLNEQCGGDGWWTGWELLKQAHLKAIGEQQWSAVSCSPPPS